MVVFINSLTGTEMLVADDRKEEYLAAGYKLAATPSEGTPAEEPKSEKKRSTKKR